MPRVFGVNHHPEIVDRARQMLILRAEARARRGHRGVVRRSAREILTRDLPGRGQRPAPAPHLGLHAAGAAALPPVPAGAPARGGARPRASTCTRTASLARRPRGQPPGDGSPTRLAGRDPRPRRDPQAPVPRRTSPSRRRSPSSSGCKPRLLEVWDALTMREEEPHTSVVVPSLTLDQSELQEARRAPASTRSGCSSCSSACATRARAWCTSPRSPSTRWSWSTTSSSWPASRPATRARA